MTPDDIPELPGVISLSRAWEMLGMNKTNLYYHIFEKGDLGGVSKIVSGNDRPVYVISLEDVLAFKDKRDDELAEAKRLAEERAPERKAAEERREFYRAAKAWGRKQGLDVPVDGFPTKALVAAYLASLERATARKARKQQVETSAK